MGHPRSYGMAKMQSVHRDAEAALTDQLRTMFDAIAEQPVPGNLMELVEVLEDKRRHREDTGDDF